MSRKPFRWLTAVAVIASITSIILWRRESQSRHATGSPASVQHNPLIADGIAGLQARLRFLKETFPALTVEIRPMIAEDDHVVAHVYVVRAPGQRGVAIMDIFRVENAKLAEHWDVLQDIPEEALNENGMV